MTIQTGLAYPIFVSSKLAQQPAGQFTMTVPGGVDVSKGKWRVSVAFYQIWYSIPNISVKNNNNQIRYYDASLSSWETLTFPTAGYLVSDICAYFTANVSAGASAGIVFGPFLTTGTQVTLASGYQVDFSSGASAGMANILGFATQVYSTTGTTISPNSANITNGLNSFLFSFPGLIDPSFSLSGNGQSNATLTPSDVLYQGAFAVPFGYKQTVEPQNPIPIPLLKGMKNVSTINVKITDQDGKTLDFNQGANYSNNASSFTLLFEQSAGFDEKTGW
jgi:hypothetical protein